MFANTIDATDAGLVHTHRVPAVRANALSTVLSFPVPATVQVGTGWDIVHAQGVTTGRFNVVTAHICNAGWARAQRGAGVARTWRQRTFERVVTTLERAMYRSADHAEVIAISHQLRSELAAYYGRVERVSVIHHGVDTALFHHATPDERAALRMGLELPADPVIALFVGDLRKGGAVALDVLAQSEGVHLVIVSGSEPAPYRAHAESVGVADRVTFRGSVPDVERYYGAADLFLFPSAYDAFGMVVSEAMASGLPVLTSRQAGASELIHHDEDGIVVGDATDSSAFALHVNRLARDRVARERMGLAARNTAERHTWDDVAHRTMQVYEQVLARR